MRNIGVVGLRHVCVTNIKSLAIMGTPVFAWTRVPVQTLIAYIEEGDTIDEFLDDFPAVTRDHAVKVLERMKVT